MKARLGASLGARAAGRLLKLVGPARFRGKGRLLDYWMSRRDSTYTGLRVLPGGGRMTCHFDVPYEAMVWARQEEEPELAALRALLRQGDHFVDCGANIGLWSLVAAGCVGDTGYVTAFEPNPVAYQRLTHNVSLSAAVGRRITVIKAAVAAQSGRLSFEQGRHHNLGRIVPEQVAGCIHVSAISLDEQFGERPIRALKLDIEGAEPDALRGAQRILCIQRPWIWAEFNVMLSGVERIGDWEVFSLLHRVGYTCRRVGAASGVPGPPVAAQERFHGYVNLLFQP